MNVNFARRTAIVVGAAALSVSVIAGTAQADPPAGVHRTLVGVGSDTTQDVLNGLSGTVGDLDPHGSSDGLLIASYDATGSDTITTRDSKPVCTDIDRPDGSGAGVAALDADIAAGNNCFDFARSSSAPNASGNLTFIPFAVDAVTVAVRSDSALPADISLTDLRHAYNCQDSSGAALPSGTFPTIGGKTVHPLVPQAGSGTRKFWASTLGFDANSLKSCVSDVAKNGVAVQEHNGNALQRTAGVDGAEDIMPFSIAQYIAQGRSLDGVTDRRGGAVLREIDSASPTDADGNLNTDFPVTREVYNAVADSRLTEPNIANTFVGDDSFLCTAVYPGTSSKVINEYGFGTADDCGAIKSTLQHVDLH